MPNDNEPQNFGSLWGTHARGSATGPLLQIPSLVANTSGGYRRVAEGYMDNPIVDVVSDSEEDLALVLSIVWANGPGRAASHYRLARYGTTMVEDGQSESGRRTTLEEDANGTPTLILLWQDEHQATPLPYELDREDITTFVAAWLRGCELPTDLSGSIGRGWRVFTEAHGHVAGYRSAIAGIQRV